jgi:hypothetical protein
MDLKLIEDRNVIKCRVNLRKNGKIFGFVKPLRNF